MVEKFWAGVSATRLSQLSFSKHNSEYLIDLIQEHLKPDGHHLDFGAGEGHLVEALIDKGYATAAYEPSTARSSRSPIGVAGQQKYLGLIDDDCIERFDVVLLVEVIEHVLEQDLASVLEKVRSLVATDGTVVVTTPLAEDLELASAYCPLCETLFHRWQHVRSFTPESLAALLERYGFESLCVRQVDFSCNRFVVEDLNMLKTKLDELLIRKEKSLVERVKRFLGYRNGTVAIRVTSSLTGTPTHILYVGKLKGRS